VIYEWYAMPEMIWFTCERCGHYKGRMVLSDSRQLCVDCEMDINNGGPVVLPDKTDIARKLLEQVWPE